MLLTIQLVVGIDFNVSEIPFQLQNGDKIIFENGGIFTLDATVASGTDALRGDLTVSDVADGELVIYIN